MKIPKSILDLWWLFILVIPFLLILHRFSPDLLWLMTKIVIGIILLLSTIKEIYDLVKELKEN